MSAETILQDITESMPLSKTVLDLSSSGQGFGLIIVDEVNGFATVGAGNLAPLVPNEQVSVMVSETDRLARSFTKQAMPILAFLDTHDSGKPQPPYPPHCEQGTGEDELVPELKWLEQAEAVTLMQKDCINGFIGALGPKGDNKLVEWVKRHRLNAVIVVGICTDVCVMDFVLTLLSARNHELIPTLQDIVVYEPGCATYDMSKEAATAIGLPETAAHPQHVTHHLGLYFMASRGALLADELI